MTEDIRQRIENSNRLTDQLERTGGRLDIGAMFEGAQREADERAQRQRELRDKEAARHAEEQKKAKEFMVKFGESVDRSKKEKADLEFKKAKVKADKELEAKIRKQNGLLSEEEEKRKNSYRSMLSNIDFYE